MIKRIRLATAKRGLGREEFAGGWREAVAAAASAPERVRPVRLTVSVSVPEIAADQRHDGVALEWFGDREHLRRFESWLGTPPGRAVQRLRSEVIELDASPVVVTSERVVGGADWLERRWQEGGPKLKQLAIAIRADGLTLPQFLERWRGRGGPAGAAPIPEAIRGLADVQNHPLVAGGRDWAYDAITRSTSTTWTACSPASPTSSGSSPAARRATWSGRAGSSRSARTRSGCRGDRWRWHGRAESWGGGWNRGPFEMMNLI